MTQKTLLWITVVAVVVIAAAVAIVAFQQGQQVRTQLAPAAPEPAVAPPSGGVQAVSVTINSHSAVNSDCYLRDLNANVDVTVTLDREAPEGGADFAVFIAAIGHAGENFKVELRPASDSPLSVGVHIPEGETSGTENAGIRLNLEYLVKGGLGGTGVLAEPVVVGSPYSIEVVASVGNVRSSANASGSYAEGSCTPAQ